MHGLFRAHSSCRRRPASSALKTLDNSLRSPFGPPLRAFNAQALLSGLRRHDSRWLLWLLIAVLLAGCSGEDVTGPGDIRWDRESCTRCAMAVSDRHFAAQVRGGAAGQKTRLYKFDDIGCAVVWLDGQPWKDDARTEIWVTDQQSGEWIDARLASYVAGKVTPMDYGLGAQSVALPGSLDFAQARQHIYAADKRKHDHTDGHYPVGPNSFGQIKPVE